MRAYHILLIILICGLNVCFGQNTFNGKYKLKPENNVGYFEMPSYLFNEDGTFELRNETDTGPVFGKGKYYISNSKLVLMYEFYEQEPDSNRSHYAIENRGYTIGDSINFSLEFVYQDSSWTGGMCFLKDTSGKRIIDKNSQQQIGWEAKYGERKINFKISKALLPFNLLILQIGHYPLNININDPIDCEVKAYMKYHYLLPRIMPAGITETFRIKNITADGFYIRGYNVLNWQHYIKNK